MSEEHRKFLIPNTTQIPDVIIDRFMPRLNGAAFKIVMYVCRRTYGFKKESDNISLDQMVEGIKKKDGAVLDEGTGLGRSTIKEECAKLVEVGILKKENHKDDAGRDKPPTYSLNLALSPSPKKPNKPRGNHVSSDPKGEGPKSGPPRGQNLAPQHPEEDNTQKVPSVGKQVSDQEDQPRRKRTRSSPDDDFCALSDDEYKERSRKIIEGAGDLGGKLTSLIRLAAAENKTGRISARRVHNEFCEPLERGAEHYSIEAWAHGLDAAIAKGVGNFEYAKKAARRRHMATAATANGIDPSELGAGTGGGMTPKSATATPQAGIEALRNYVHPKGGPNDLRKFAYLAERFDFVNQEADWRIRKELSQDTAEQQRLLERIQTVVRRAVREQEAS